MTIYHGEIFGSTDAAQLPSKPYDWGYLIGSLNNGGNIYIGSSSDIAFPASTTDTNTTTGYPLDAGVIFELKTPGDLNELWYRADSTTDALIYFVKDV